MGVTTPLTPPSVIEQEIEARKDHAFVAEGYVTESGNPDPNAMQDAAYRVVRSRVVNSKAERADNAIGKGELCAAVFPNAPGADGNYDQLDEFDRKVWELLERDVWSLTQPKSTGALQKRLDDEDSTLVLLRPTIRRKLIKLPVVYLTDNPSLIREDGVDKEIKAWERKAANLRKELDMMMRRHPELESIIRSEVNQSMSRAKATLTVPKNGQKELPEGDGSDSK